MNTITLSQRYITDKYISSATNHGERAKDAQAQAEELCYLLERYCHRNNIEVQWSTQFWPTWYVDHSLNTVDYNVLYGIVKWGLN